MPCKNTTCVILFSSFYQRITGAASICCVDEYCFLMMGRNFNNNLRLRTWLGCERFRASATACVGTRCGAMPVGFEPSRSSDRTALCAKQRAPLYASDSRRAVAAPPSRRVELETHSTMPRGQRSSVELLKVRGLGLFYHWHWTCFGRHPHEDGEVPASGGAAVVNVV